MKATKKREIGVGDNLYGIPINDIVTPIELEEIKTTSRKTASGKRRKKAKKPHAFNLPRFNMPHIRLTAEATYIVSGVVAVLFMLIIFKNPIMSHVAPKLCVSSAIEETVTEILGDAEDNINGFLGFDLEKKKEFSLNFKGKAHNDTLSYMNGISLDGSVGYSKGQKNLSGLWWYSVEDEPLTSATFYLNNDEVGFSLPEIMGEYWVAPTKTFGKAWNESGMRKISYANAIDEDFDISFSNIFGDGFFTEKGKKKIIKLTDRIFSKADSDYRGKIKKDIDGNTKKCRNFTFTFREAEVEQYISSLAELILNDTSCRQKLSCMGLYGNASQKLGDISLRLSDGVSFGDVRMDVLEYKGAVVSLEITANYAENGNNVIFNLAYDTQNTKNPLNHMSFSVSNGDNFSILLCSEGSRTKQQFSYETRFEIISNIDKFSLDSIFSSDFGNETISGTLKVYKNGKTDNIQYSGKCRQKGGLSIELDRLDVTTLTTDVRTVSGEFLLKAEPCMNIGKVNVAGKKNIFEMNKAETENYLKKLQENEKMKKFLDINNRISGEIR